MTTKKNRINRIIFLYKKLMFYPRKGNSSLIFLINNEKVLAENFK